MKLRNTPNTLLALALSLLLFACTKSATDQPETLQNSVSLTMNGITLESIGDAVIANENCGLLHVNASFRHAILGQSRLQLAITPNGAVKSFELRSLEITDSNYATPKYNPASAIQIESLEYTPTSLSFRFRGNLLGELPVPRNANSTEPRLPVSGSIRIPLLQSVSCLVNTIHSSYEDPSGSLRMESIQASSERRSNAENIIVMDMDNGYRVSFVTPQRLTDLPVGNYSFQATSQARMEVSRFSAVPYRSDWLAKPGDWTNYQTSGTFRIEQQQLINGTLHVSGSADLLLSSPGQPDQRISGLRFLVAPL